MENIKKNIPDLIRVVFLSAIVGVLGYSFLGIILLFYPSFFMIRSIRYGIVPAMIAMVLSSGIVSLFMGPLAGMALVLVYGTMTLIFHYCITSGKGFYTTFLAMVLVLFLATMVLNYGLSQSPMVDPVAITEDFAQIQSEMTEGMTNLEIRRLEDSVSAVIDMMSRLSFSISVISGMITAYINYVITGRRLLLNRIIINQPPIFPNLSVPREVLLSMGLVAGAGLLLNYYGIDPEYSIILNGMVIYGFIYFINGMAFLNSILLLMRIPRILRLIIYYFCISIQYISVVVILVGVIDSLISIRKVKIL